MRTPDRVREEEDEGEEVLAWEEGFLAARRKEREKLRLHLQPWRTLKLFSVLVLRSARDGAEGALRRMRAASSVFPLLAGALCIAGTALVLVAGVNEHVVVRALMAAVWWVGLGAVSTVGLGTGMSSGFLYLLPHTMATVLAVETCGNGDFSTVGSAWFATADDAFKCRNPVEEAEDAHVSFIVVWRKVLPACLAYGIGTALGEIPPFLLARAARMSADEEDIAQSETLANKAAVKTTAAATAGCKSTASKHGPPGSPVVLDAAAAPKQAPQQLKHRSVKFTDTDVADANVGLGPPLSPGHLHNEVSHIPMPPAPSPIGVRALSAEVLARAVKEEEEDAKKDCNTLSPSSSSPSSSSSEQAPEPAHAPEPDQAPEEEEKASTANKKGKRPRPTALEPSNAYRTPAPSQRLTRRKKRTAAGMATAAALRHAGGGSQQSPLSASADSTRKPGSRRRPGFMSALWQRVSARIVFFLSTYGFWGLLLLAACPNPAFDFCGILCGQFLMPASEFVLATLLGKGVIRSLWNTTFYVTMLSQTHVEAVVALVQRCLPDQLKLDDAVHTAIMALRTQFHPDNKASAAGADADADTDADAQAVDWVFSAWKSLVAILLCVFVISTIEQLAQYRALQEDIEDLDVERERRYPLERLFLRQERARSATVCTVALPANAQARAMRAYSEIAIISPLRRAAFDDFAVRLVSTSNFDPLLNGLPTPRVERRAITSPARASDPNNTPLANAGTSSSVSAASTSDSSSSFSPVGRRDTITSQEERTPLPLPQRLSPAEAANGFSTPADTTAAAGAASGRTGFPLGRFPLSSSAAGSTGPIAASALRSSTRSSAMGALRTLMSPLGLFSSPNETAPPALSAPPATASQRDRNADTGVADAPESKSGARPQHVAQIDTDPDIK